MTEQPPIDAAADTLIEGAVRKKTWRDALRVLGLAATRENVEGLRRRASALGLDTSHLRWQRSADDISTSELRAAVLDASSVSEVLGRLGLKPGGWTYTWLEQLSEQRGVRLPPRRSGDALGARARCSDEAIHAEFARARSMADLLRRLGIVPAGGNYRYMRARLERLGLDPDALAGKAWSRGSQRVRKPLSHYLQPGRPCSSVALATRLLAEGIFERRCQSCDGITWLGSPTPIELDHINGDPADNRLENLRLLCPNCHALTPTYRGRNIGRRRRTLEAEPG